MIDVADGTLVDVSETSLADLDTESTALDRALARILSVGKECRFNSFNSGI
jgi:FXSXX-COOH protein